MTRSSKTKRQTKQAPQDGQDGASAPAPAATTAEGEDAAQTPAPPATGENMQAILDDAHAKGLLDEPASAEQLQAEGVTAVRIEEVDGQLALVQTIAGDDNGEAAGDPAGSNDDSGDEQTAAPSPDPEADALAEAIAELADVAGVSVEEADAALAAELAAQPDGTDPLALAGVITEAIANGGELREGTFVAATAGSDPEPADEPNPNVAGHWVRNLRTGIAWAVSAAKAQQLLDSGEYEPVLEDEG